MKRIFTQTLAVFAMAAFSSTAMADGVVVNETNFPDPYLRDYVSGIDWDENGILEGDEYDYLSYVDCYNVTNFKGLELLPVKAIGFRYSGDVESELAYKVKSADFSKLCPNLETLNILHAFGLESLDLSGNKKLTRLRLLNCPVLKDIKYSSSIESISFEDLQSIPTVNGSDLPNLTDLDISNWDIRCSVENINFTGHQNINSIVIGGTEEVAQNINTFHVEDCPNLGYISVRYATVQGFTIKNLPVLNDFNLNYTTAENVDIQECPELDRVVCNENELGTLNVSNNAILWDLQCNNNKLKTLIADNCPMLTSVWAWDNQLMWLDMKDVKKGEYYDGENANENFMLDNQNPSVQAVKISPTEVGLRVHSRLDVSRVLNLKAKGMAMEPKEIFVDGIRYFVIYNDGPSIECLVGADGNSYQYDTQWPYPFVEGNSQDNLLPVTYHVTSWTKHQAFIKLSHSTVKGVYGQPAPQAPTVTRSQDYDGKLTWSSSNEKVVKVNAETGELTVVGAGTATITVSGAETDYRLAPSSISYSVVIDKATPEFAFEQAEIESADGFVPQNKLSIGLYDGTVVYTSSDEEIATVDADGKVTAKQAGSVTIIATGAETANCKEASAQYVLNILSTDGIEGIQAKDGEAVIYNLSGQRVNGNAKGIQIRNGKKVLVK